jgi:hypothetical protein
VQAWFVEHGDDFAEQHVDAAGAFLYHCVEAENAADAEEYGFADEESDEEEEDEVDE